MNAAAIALIIAKVSSLRFIRMPPCTKSCIPKICAASLFLPAATVLPPHRLAVAGMRTAKFLAVAPVLRPMDTYAGSSASVKERYVQWTQKRFLELPIESGPVAVALLTRLECARSWQRPEGIHEVYMMDASPLEALPSDFNTGSVPAPMPDGATRPCWAMASLGRPTRHTSSVPLSQDKEFEVLLRNLRYAAQRRLPQMFRGVPPTRSTSSFFARIAKAIEPARWAEVSDARSTGSHAARRRKLASGSRQ